jgi:hypothetical protein
MEIVLESSFDSIASLYAVARGLLESAAEPVILDAHNVRARLTLVTAFAGAREDVQYQAEIARKLASWVERSTAYDQKLANKVSVLPSNTADALVRLDGARFIARLGNGLIYHEGERVHPAETPNQKLIDRVKNAYDPHNIFPKYSL